MIGLTIAFHACQPCCVVAVRNVITMASKPKIAKKGANAPSCGSNSPARNTAPKTPLTAAFQPMSSPRTNSSAWGRVPGEPAIT